MVVEEIESLMEMKQLAISHQIRKLTYNPIVTARKVKKSMVFLVDSHVLSLYRMVLEYLKENFKK
jgi:hypothetical protein